MTIYTSSFSQTSADSHFLWVVVRDAYAHWTVPLESGSQLLKSWGCSEGWASAVSLWKCLEVRRLSRWVFPCFLVRFPLPPSAWSVLVVPRTPVELIFLCKEDSAAAAGHLYIFITASDFLPNHSRTDFSWFCCQKGCMGTRVWFLHASKAPTSWEEFGVCTGAATGPQDPAGATAMCGALGPESAGQKIAKGVVFCNTKLNWALSHWVPTAVHTSPLLEVTSPAAAMVKYSIKPYGSACMSELKSEQYTWVHPWGWF